MRLLRLFKILWVARRYGLDKILADALGMPLLLRLVDSLRWGRDFDSPRGARLRLALEELGLTVTPSVANFLLVRFPDAAGYDAETAWEALKSRGILTRKMTSYGLPAYLRITIGAADEMQATVAAIAAFLRS